jgi:hypothetical protein
MHHISPVAFGAAATTAVTLGQSRIRPSRRAAKGADDSFIDSVSCSLIAPTHVLVEETATESLSVVKLGFSLVLHRGMALEWVRFAVRIALDGNGRTDHRPSRIASLYPIRVATRIIAKGRMAIGADGEMMREEMPADETANGAPTYEPNLLGWRLSDSEAIWDWLPVRRVPPLGADALLLSVKYPARAGLRCTRSIQLAVGSEDRTDIMVLEHEAEIAELAGPGPA